MTTQLAKPITTNTNPPRTVRQPAYWSLGLSNGVLYAKAFQEHWNAEFHNEADVFCNVYRRYSASPCHKPTYTRSQHVRKSDNVNVNFTVVYKVQTEAGLICNGLWNGTQLACGIGERLEQI